MNRRVTFSPRTRREIANLYDYIADSASEAVAARYIDRLERYCLGFELFGERGTMRDDLKPGVRSVGFERRVTILFTVTATEVLILRILYGGQDVEAALRD